MQCRYLFLCVALSACSPLHYYGERVTGTYTQQAVVDSVSLQRMMDRVVHEEIAKQLNVRNWSDGTEVKEIYSAPDSVGRQYLMERTTSTGSTHTETTASSSHRKDEQIQEKVDSSGHKTSEYIEIKQEERKTEAKADGWSPWRYLPVLLVVLVLGFLLGMRSRKWIIK